MALASDFAQTLKQQADIVRVVGDYVSLKKAGGENYAGLCPFHKEKTASFTVSATKQFYYCFGCHASGDVFKFVQTIENISFPEAIRAVAQKMGVALPKETFNTEAEARDAKMRTALLEIHERACSFFQEYLWRSDGARAREYLAGRGLDEATIRKFRIGLAPDSGFLLRDRLKGEKTAGFRRQAPGLREALSSRLSALSGTAGPSTPPGNPRADRSASLGMTVLRRNPRQEPRAESREPPSPPCIPSSVTGLCSPLRTRVAA